MKLTKNLTCDNTHTGLKPTYDLKLYLVAAEAVLNVLDPVSSAIVTP